VQSPAGACPECGSPGETVDRRTVLALVAESARQRLTSRRYRFCREPECDVVYFDEEGARFATQDLRVAVWQKRGFGDRQVCYCFGDSEASIRAELEVDGQSHAADRIRAHIAAGRCECDVRNPRGSCCLGDVIAAVARVEAALLAAAGAGSRARDRSVR
jgi:hypothetical protein